jgi:hypothetical protein
MMAYPPRVIENLARTVNRSWIPDYGILGILEPRIAVRDILLTLQQSVRIHDFNSLGSTWPQKNVPAQLDVGEVGTPDLVPNVVGRPKLRRYARGVVPTIPAKYARTTDADLNPECAPTFSTDKRVVARSRWARRTRTVATHCAGVAPTRSRKSPAQGFCAHCRPACNHTQREIFALILFDPNRQRTDRGVVVDSRGFVNNERACPPARSNGITTSRAVGAAISAPRSRRTMWRHKSNPAAAYAEVKILPLST